MDPHKKTSMFSVPRRWSRDRKLDASSQTRPPPGGFVVLVGPDGVGKTTLARALIDAWPGSAAYFHFLPRRLRHLEDRPPDHEQSVQKNRRMGSPVLGWLRIVRNLMRFWAAYVLAIRPAVRGGSLVVGDRWAYGYVAQPMALRFYGPMWLARRVVRLVPCPDLVVNLAAPAELIFERKPELELDEIEVESIRWAQLPCGPVTLDASQAPTDLASIVLKCVQSCSDPHRRPE